MGDHYDGDVLAGVDLGEEVGEARGVRAVERARGLVGEEELRAVDECAGDGGALAFTAGELARAVVETVAEADGFQQFFGARAKGGAVGGFAGERGDEDIFQRGALWEQVVELEDEAHRCIPKRRQLVRVQLGEILAGYDHLAGLGLVERAEEIEQRAFSRSARAHDGGGFAFGDLEIESAEHRHGGLGGAVGFRDVAEFGEHGGSLFLYAARGPPNGNSRFPLRTAPRFWHIVRRMDILTLDLPGIRKVASGKVREIFDLGEHLLFVATDRISAFDCILPNPIPRKGEVLTQLSDFWFQKMTFVENHLVAVDFADFLAQLRPFEEQLRGRSMIVKKAKPLPIECVVRGYLIGSGWKDYQSTGAVCGIPLPHGLAQAAKLPETIFTPASKAATGHDENISWEQAVALCGESVAQQARALSLRIYEEGRAHAAECGIILADTKFEFGIFEGRVILIDEVLTPDSSRYWPAADYREGTSPASFDKQFVRDYLETLVWDKTPPAPPLPPDVVEKTAAKYREAYQRLTGRAL